MRNTFFALLIIGSLLGSMSLAAPYKEIAQRVLMNDLGYRHVCTIYRYSQQDFKVKIEYRQFLNNNLKTIKHIDETRDWGLEDAIKPVASERAFCDCSLGTPAKYPDVFQYWTFLYDSVNPKPTWKVIVSANERFYNPGMDKEKATFRGIVDTYCNEVSSGY